MLGSLFQNSSLSAADAFKRQAVSSSYYSWGFSSFVASLALLGAAPFMSDGKDIKTLCKGSAVLALTSFGCFYKSRYDLTSLRDKVKADSSSSK